jgi:hypothetical protein
MCRDPLPQKVYLVKLMALQSGTMLLATWLSDSVVSNTPYIHFEVKLIHRLLKLQQRIFNITIILSAETLYMYNNYREYISLTSPQL